MKPEHIWRGRGVSTNPDNRFAAAVATPLSDEDVWWETDDPAPPATTLRWETAKSAIAYNASPDLPFDRSLNPYRGCEHGCAYCYARPSHAVMGLSPGLDFETRLFAKPQAAERLKAELAKPGYRVAPIALGTNTDPYQPVEKTWRITRLILKVLSDCGHPVTIVTKSHLVVRDLDILGPMAARGLAKVAVSITTLDRSLARSLEPRASTPARRLDAIRLLADAGVPTGVMVAPVIPGLTDAQMESVMTAARRAGAVEAGWVMLRLPLEVRPLFEAWLEEAKLAAAGRVRSLIRQIRDGRANDPQFHSRMRGTGPYADLVAKRFRLAADRLGYGEARQSLRLDLFCPPRLDGQMDMFS